MQSKSLALLSLKKAVFIKPFTKALGAFCLLLLVVAGCGHKRKGFFRRPTQAINKLTLPFVSDVAIKDNLLTWKPIQQADLVGYVIYSSHPQRRFVKEGTLLPTETSFCIPEMEMNKRYAIAGLFRRNDIKREGPLSTFIMVKK